MSGPKKICKYGHNCTNKKCLLDHSSTPDPGSRACRYGSNCTNGLCTYSHPPDRVKPGTGDEDKTKPPPSCKYGSKCTNAHCAFSHDQTTTAAGGKRAEACKFGSKCTKAECPFTHDNEGDSPSNPKECHYGSKCTNKQCPFTHNTKEALPKTACHFGSKCTNKQCSYSHPDDESKEAGPVKLTLIHINSGLQVCKYGSICSKSNCEKLHPERKTVARAQTVDTSSKLQPAQLTGALTAMSEGPHAPNKSMDARVCKQRMQTLLPDTPFEMISHILKASWPPLERAQLLAVVVHSLLGPKNSHAVLSALSHQSALITAQRISVERCLKRLWLASSTDPAFAKIQDEHAAHNRGLEELVQQQAAFEHQLSELVRPKTVDSDSLGQSIRREAFRLAPFQIKDRTKVFTNPLPALAKRNELLDMLNSGQQLIIVRGETGSGKSTQLPQYVADFLGTHSRVFGDKESPFLGPNKKVVCTQPRKIAAITLAQRVAYEYSGGAVRQTSNEVGCKVGSNGQKKKQGGSVITFMTEALLLKSLLKSRENLNHHSGWHAIILDEAHERSVNTDLLLGLVKERLAVDRDLRVIVTSATLDTELFIKYFTTALTRPPLLEIPGRMFPVEEVYVPIREDQNLVNAAAHLAFELHRDTPIHAGDILVFLAAQEDTEAAKSQLKALLTKPGSKNATVLCLYGKQAPEEHEKAFAPTPKDTRKIVFSTNVAETSVTIDGIKMVIDSGVCKENRFDAKRNMFLLEETTISQSSATQRKGRAGRTAPGSVYRLFSREDYEKLRTGQVAELLRSPLGLTILKLLERKILISKFMFIEPPSAEDIAVAAEELFFLGAIENPSGWACSACTFVNCSSCAPDCNHQVCEVCQAKRPADQSSQFALTTETKLTEFGVFAARADVDPRIARILFVGAQLGFPDTALTLACLLSVEGNVKFRGGDTKMQLKADLLHAALARQLECVDKSDILLIYKIYERWSTLDHWWVDAIHGKPEHYAVADDVQDVKEEEPSSFLTEGWLQRHNAELAEEKQQIGEDQEEQVGPIDDAISLASGFDDAASIVSEAKSERGFKHVQALRKKWCRGWSLNSKSLGIAESTRRDLELVMKNNDLNMQQAGEATDDVIIKLFFAGYFLNLASKNGRQYRSLGSHMLSLIHPSSPLLQQALPENVSYFRMFSTSKNFLLLVAPVSTEEKDLKEIIPKALLSAFKAKLAPITVVSQRLPGSACYASSLLKAAIGIKNKDKSSIEEQYSVTLEVEYSHPAHVMVWGTAEQIAKASEAITSKIKAVEAQLLREAQEEVMLGSTRANFGSGCMVQRILLGNEFVRLAFTNLPTDFELAELQQRAEIFGTVTSSSLELLKSGKSQWGAVSYEDPKAAELALANLDQQPLRPRGPPVNVKRGGTVHDSQHSVSDTTVVVSWASQAASGSAVVKCRTAKDANNCLRQAPLLGYTANIRPNAAERARIEQQRALGAASFEAYNRGDKELAADLKKQKLALQATGKFFSEEEVKGETSYGIDVQGLNPATDELHLLEQFRKCGGNLRVRINRGTRVCTKFQTGKCDRGANCKFSHTLESVNEDTKVDETTLATINSVTMQKVDDVVLRSEATFNYGRAEMRFRMRSYQAARKMLNQVRTRAYQPMHGQLLRATITLSHVCSFHKELFVALQKEFEKIYNAATQAGIDVYLDDHTTPGRTKVQLSTLLGSGAEEDDNERTNSFNIARTALNQLLTCKIITHPRKFVMFSSAGRQFMQNWATQKKQAYIHWDHRFQTIRLYGIAPDIEVLEAAIMDMIGTLGPSFNVIRLPLAPASIRAARKLQSQIRSVDVMEMQFDKAALVLTTNPEGEARVRNLLQEHGIVIGKPQAAPANETDCAVCFCPIDNPFQLKACGHIFCRECISGASGGSLPLKCPMCNQLWIWRDVVTLLGPKLVELERRAYDEYLATAVGRATYGNCPSRQGCEQKFVQDVTNPRYTEIFDCDQCNISYCIPCSGHLAAPIEHHPDMKCQDFRRGLQTKSDMQMILQLPDISPCPSCKTLINKNLGCYHMTCAPPHGCGAHFCWGCMNLFEHDRCKCTCAQDSGNAWFGGADPTCRYVYHHMSHCKRPVHT